MQEMIEAEPGLAEPVLSDPAAVDLGEAVGRAVDRGEPLAVVGCGTSEHGAMAVAEQITEALGGRGRAHARQSFEAMLDPWPAGACIGISHEGGTAATVAAMASARRAGAAVGLITAAEASDAAKGSDHTLVTPLRDRSWCHTVGYVSPILGGAAVAAACGLTVDPRAARGALSISGDTGDAVRTVATSLHGVARYLTVGSGADRIAARELALKIEEGVRVPASARDLETILHGHWVAQDEGTAVVLILTDPREQGARAARASQMLRAAASIGCRTAAIVTPETGAGIATGETSAGRIVVPDPSALPPSTGSLLASAPALQHLTLELVHLAGVNPDLIRREDAPYRAAAAIAEASLRTAAD